MIMLIGNKMDLEDKRVVPKQEGEAFAQTHSTSNFLSIKFDFTKTFSLWKPVQKPVSTLKLLFLLLC